jgi:hypothetical protein
MISQLIGKTVEVQAEGIRVRGRFTLYCNGSRDGHVPTVLVLEDEFGRLMLMRDWNAIIVTGEKT